MSVATYPATLLLLSTQIKRPRRCKRPGGSLRGRPLRDATGVFEARGRGSMPSSEPFALTRGRLCLLAGIGGIF